MYGEKNASPFLTLCKAVQLISTELFNNLMPLPVIPLLIIPSTLVPRIFMNGGSALRKLNEVTLCSPVDVSSKDKRLHGTNMQLINKVKQG